MIKRNLLAIFIAFVFHTSIGVQAQTKTGSGVALAAKPPMGWLSANNSVELNEIKLRETADAMVSSGMLKAGYEYLVVDDGWQGGRDNRNQLLADSVKFPSGIPALAEYFHSRGLKLGLTANAAQLSCAGFTASLNFEEQDAKTFAQWGVDLLKYEYCRAPSDSATTVTRYKTMSEALRKSGRDIVLEISEGGVTKPWYWAAQAGAQVWHTAGGVADIWKGTRPLKQATGYSRGGILDITDSNSAHHQFAGIGKWNNAGNLVVGLYGKGDPTGDGQGEGCTDTEYQSQMSIWCMMASPLFTSLDISQMNPASRRILMNEEIIAINQDALGKQAERVIHNEDWTVWLKALSNGDYGVAILNRSDNTRNYSINWSKLGLTDQFVIRDVWSHQLIGKGRRWKGRILSHETRVFRLKKV